MVVLAMVLALPALALAFAPTAPGQEGSGGPAIIHASELDVQGSLIRYQRGSSEAAARPGVAELFEQYSADWEIMWDERSDLPNLISGRGIPMFPGAGNALEGFAPRSLAEVESLARTFMEHNSRLFEARGSEFKLRHEGSGSFGRNGQLWFVELQQFYNNIPVEGAYLSFRFNNGNLIQFGAERVAPISIDTDTKLLPEEALEMALEALGRKREEVSEVLKRGDLKIFPAMPTGEAAGNRYKGPSGFGYRHLLVRESIFRLQGDDATYRALVDVHSRKVIDLKDINETIDVRGGIYPESYLDTEVVQDFQYVATSGDSTSLDGVYTRISDGCGSISVSDSSDGSTDGIINLGTSGGTDCTTPGYGGSGNTHSARTGHYHLTNINRIADSYHPSNSWLDSKLTANMNINNTCNAYWNGSTVNFYRSGGGCGNTGEIAAVFLHEWGHGMDSNTGGGSDSGTGETVGDTFAMLYLRSSCIGQGFFSDGTDCYNCDSCSGVRDPADFSYHEGVSTIATPANVTSNTGIDCDRWSCPYTGYMGPMGYEGHCESYISSSAIWDLGVELRTAHGTETGWDTLEQLWYDSLIPSKQAFEIVSGGQCNTAAVTDGCASSNYYQVFLAADDDDGNLSNGTPNGCRIWDAFNYHSIACGSRPECSTGCTPSPVADAGPNQTICAGDSVQIGTAALADHTYSWSPGGYTVAQPTVSPSATTTYTVTATTSCGSTTDSVTVTVDDGSGGGLSANMEGDTSGWSTTGLWHLTSSSSCASPGYSSATHAFYYGQDSSCNYDAGDTSGDLISPTISGINSSSTLSFDYFRQVESYSGAYDTTTVAVEVAGTGSWTTVWSRDSSTASENAWTASGTIDISAFAGSDIRVRFQFDSIDGSYNTYTGWFIDDVVVTGESPCGGNSAPNVTITAPANGSTYTDGDTVSFSGTAIDAEDGTLTSSLSWTSSRDGVIGSGGSFATSTLSVGVHTITASVTDSGGLGGSDSIQVTITTPSNNPPAVTITAPSDGAAYTVGDTVSFAGTASDTEDGDLTSSLSWSSSLDGVIGSGGSFATSGLSEGVHTITASVTDSGGLGGSDSIQVSINPISGCPAGSIDFSAFSLTSYADQNVTNGVAVEDGGDTLHLTGNTWVRSTSLFTITSNTVVEFSFASSSQGEIHAIGFDENDTLNDLARHFQYWGTQDWTGVGRIDWTPKYTGGGASQSYTIPVGQYYTGSMYLVFANDNDAGTSNEGLYQCVRVYETTPPACDVTEGFESGSGGWTNSGTCTTGAFVAGSPTLVQDGGVTTQVSGAQSGSNAWFTAPNSSAGTDDVDGGVCITQSPVYNVTADSDVEVWYFHGQRDAGDDPSGDYFALEISVNGGAWTSLASYGDVAVNAVWTKVTAAVSAGDTVQLRASASDGTYAGDLVEAGLDSVSICEQ